MSVLLGAAVDAPAAVTPLSDNVRMPSAARIRIGVRTSGLNLIMCLLTPARQPQKSSNGGHRRRGRILPNSRKLSVAVRYRSWSMGMNSRRTRRRRSPYGYATLRAELVHLTCAHSRIPAPYP